MQHLHDQLGRSLCANSWQIDYSWAKLYSTPSSESADHLLRLHAEDFWWTSQALVDGGLSWSQHTYWLNDPKPHFEILMVINAWHRVSMRQLRPILAYTWGITLGMLHGSESPWPGICSQSWDSCDKPFVRFGINWWFRWRMRRMRAYCKMRTSSLCGRSMRATCNQTKANGFLMMISLIRAMTRIAITTFWHIDFVYILVATRVGGNPESHYAFRHMSCPTLSRISRTFRATSIFDVFIGGVTNWSNSC